MNPLAAIPAYFDMARARPGKRPARAAWDSAKYDDAFDAQVKSKGGDPSIIDIEDPVYTEPKSIHEGVRQMMGLGKGRPDAFGSNHVPEGHPNATKIRINPNADEAFLAHELGHIASKQAGLGKLVRNLRDNPALTKALGQASLGAPLALAALIPGDDDLAPALAASYLAASPELLDEAFATQNALAMMNRAGSRATLGQRGKLAGAYLSYLGAPLAAGLGGQIAGNFADDEVTALLGYGQ
jgi:hypothetical protein